MIKRSSLLERMIASGMIALLCAGGAAWAQDNATGPAVPPGTEADHHASPAPEETWPPGLFMKCLEKAGVRKPLDDAGIRVWGFIEGGITFDLTHGDRTLFGRYYDARRVGDPRLNQLLLTIDRPYDPSKTSDWGFRVDNLFGGDALLTHAAGMLDHAGEGTGDAWFDIPQMYAQGWFKTGKDSGLEFTLGKFLELSGSESAEAVLNLLYSHSDLYTFLEPTTLTGGVAKYYFNSQVFGYLGVVEGWDVFKDNNDAMTYLAGGGWSSKEQIAGHARTQALLNIMIGPERAHNTRDYRTLIDVIINQSWTEKLSESLNVEWLAEENVPGVDNKLAEAYGAAHYLTYVFNDRVSATWRGGSTTAPEAASARAGTSTRTRSG